MGQRFLLLANRTIFLSLNVLHIYVMITSANLARTALLSLAALPCDQNGANYQQYTGAEVYEPQSIIWCGILQLSCETLDRPTSELHAALLARTAGTVWGDRYLQTGTPRLAGLGLTLCFMEGSPVPCPDSW